MDGHKLLWHLDRVLEWQKKRLIPPVYLEVSPVSYCNHQCIFCGVDFAREERVSLKSNEFLKSVRELGEHGIRSIMFAGEGEPLLHRDIPSFVRVAKESGIDVSMTTNGAFGNCDIWEEILPYMEWVRFSLDAGSAGTYSRVHNVPESHFSRSLNSIKDAVKTRRDLNLKTAIGIQFLVINENLSDIRSVLELLPELGVDYLTLKPYSLHPQMTRKRDITYSEGMLSEIEDAVNSFSHSNCTDIIFRRSAFRKYSNGIKEYSRCSALPFWGYISSKGDFYTCSVFLGDERFIAGNIYDNTMSDIIFGEARSKSINYGEQELDTTKECRLNCRMARVNEFLESLKREPDHLNFI